MKKSKALGYDDTIMGKPPASFTTAWFKRKITTWKAETMEQRLVKCLGLLHIYGAMTDGELRKIRARIERKHKEVERKKP